MYEMIYFMRILQEIKKGASFNFLTYTGNAKIGLGYEFECVCGKKKYWKGLTSIITGRVKSCGCQRFKSKYDFSVGVNFGHLTLTGKSEVRVLNGYDRRYCECVCVCGKIIYTRQDCLVDGIIRSCGCKHGESIGLAHTIHGCARTNKKHPLYNVWGQIKRRCYSEDDIGYPYYGARGVKMCDEWLNNFKSFYDWAISNGWERGLQIDKDIRAKEIGIPALLYSPEMCMIVDRRTQMRSRGNNINITAFGKTKCLMDWSKDARCMVGYMGLKDRIKKWKWEPERAISTPPTNKGNKLTGQLKNNYKQKT